MAVLSADFNTGTNGNTVATSDTGSASAFDLVSANALSTNAKANVKYDNTHAVVGSLACMIATGSAPGVNPYVGWSTLFGTQTTHYGRLYLYLTANPSGGNLVVARPFSGASSCGQVRINTSGVVVVADSSGTIRATGTSAISLNQWIRIDFQFVHSVSAGSVVAKLYNTASSTTPTETITSSGSFSTLASANSIELGNTSGLVSTTHWQASLIANATAFPGPIIANTAAPTISGSAAVGSTLSYSGDTWNVTPTSYTYQWTRAGVNIGGATSSTYVTVSADIGNAVGLKLTAIGVAANETATVSSSNTITVTGGSNVTGDAARSETLTIAAAGTRKALGAATRPETLTFVSAGTRKALGAAARPETLTFAATGVRTRFGAAARAETLAFTAAGTVTRNGSAALNLSLNRTAAGTRTTFATATIPTTLTITVASASPPPPTQLNVTGGLPRPRIAQQPELEDDDAVAVSLLLLV